MDFQFSDEEKAFIKEVEDFVEKELPSDWDEKAFYWPVAYGTTLYSEQEYQDIFRSFSRKLGEKGWLSLMWPAEYGGESSPMKQAILSDILDYHRAAYDCASMVIYGPTIALHGSDEMKNKWLPRIAAGEATFWLAYSEPDAGSDLASIQTTAVEDGDDLVLNGQKIWSTGAHVMDYAWLIARTNPNVRRDQGISLMIVDTKSQGISVRPLINICGLHSFNEVFFDNVRVPKQNIIGEKDKGFYYLMSALQGERFLITVGTFRRTFEELVEYVKTAKYDGRPLREDPSVRNKLADLKVDLEVLYGFYWRTVWLMENRLFSSELDASALKLFATEFTQKLANTGMEILGLYGQLEQGSNWAPLKGRIGLGYLDSVSATIGAGTSDIQRMIMATRGLGLPKK